MRVAAVLCAALLIGCSSAPPERSFYVLRDGQMASGAGPVSGFTGIGRISIPAYLNRSELVVQTGSNEIRPARYHHWGEPLEDGIRHYLRAAVTQRVGEEIAADVLLRDAWEYQIDLTFETFHGGLTGGVGLNASFVVFRVKGGEVLATRRVVTDVRLNGDGYAMLVDAHARLLDELADEIAAVLESIQ